MEPYLGLRGRPLSIIIGVVSGLIFFLYGYDQGNMAGFLTISSFLAQFPPIGDFSHGLLPVAQKEGLTVAVWNLGCFASAVVAIFVGDRLGRKKMVYMGLAFLLVGEIIQCTSFKWGQFVAGRLIAGFGNGFNCATIPAWQAECTKAHRRGTLLMISAGACIAAGLAFSYWMDFAFAWVDPNTAAWRVPIALQIVLIISAFSLLWFMPESPRWLILQGREGEALTVLSALNDLDETNVEIHQEFLQIKDAVIQMMGASFRQAFKMGDYRDLHRVVLAVMLQFFQQIGGINFMTQYFAQMFEMQYQTVGWVARLLASLAGTVFFLASFVSVWSIDRICGRRGLMLFGTSGMLLSMIILTIMVWANSRASLDVGIAFVFIFTTFFAVGWQGIAWLVQAEIVPLRIRGPANAMSTASNWLANFIVVVISPPAFVNITWRTYLIFVSTNAVILPIIYFLYPETGLRCLEEIDYIFHTANSSPRPWLDVKKIAANEPLWYGSTITQEDAVPFDYENSVWHQRHVRFSDEVKDVEGGSTTLQGTSSSDGDEKNNKKATRGGGSGSSRSGSSENEIGNGAVGRLVSEDGGVQRSSGDDGAPAPAPSTPRSRPSSLHSSRRSSGRYAGRTSGVSEVR